VTGEATELNRVAETGSDKGSGAVRCLQEIGGKRSSTVQSDQQKLQTDTNKYVADGKLNDLQLVQSRDGTIGRQEVQKQAEDKKPNQETLDALKGLENLGLKGVAPEKAVQLFNAADNLAAQMRFEQGAHGLVVRSAQHLGFAVNEAGLNDQQKSDLSKGINESAKKGAYRTADKVSSISFGKEEHGLDALTVTDGFNKSKQTHIYMGDVPQPQWERKAPGDPVKAQENLDQSAATLVKAIRDGNIGSRQSGETIENAQAQALVGFSQALQAAGASPEQIQEKVNQVNQQTRLTGDPMYSRINRELKYVKEPTPQRDGKFKESLTLSGGSSELSTIGYTLTPSKRGAAEPVNGLRSDWLHFTGNIYDNNALLGYI
jgi:hypothetical protein